MHKLNRGTDMNDMERFGVELSRFDIVDIDEMLTYEDTDENRVKEISEDLVRRNTLINPVLYDPKIKLLIDGNHRVNAFKLLNINHIATFNVNYFTNEVSVGNWYRFLSGIEVGQLDNILHLLLTSKYTLPDCPGFYLEIEYPDGATERIPFSNSLELSAFLKILHDSVISAGGRVELSPEKEIHQNDTRNSLVLSTTPTIGKTEVFNTARSSKTFCFQVNRHLINNRPLGIDLPLAFFALRKTDTILKYREHISNSRRISTGKGRWHHGRFYEENTILFHYS